MQQSQREHLSRKQIEERAAGMLRAVLGDKFTPHHPAPLNQLISIFQSKKWLTFSNQEELGTLPGNRVIYGEFNVEPTRIRISSQLQQNSYRYRFTLAHEIGHFALHRKMIGTGKYINRKQIPSDSAKELKYREMATLSDLGWVEWQANEFALSLTLPIITLYKKIRNLQEAFGVNRNKGIIFLDDQPKNRLLAKRIVVNLENECHIPRVFLWKRLRYLGLLKDQRKHKSNTAHESLNIALP